MSTPIEQNTADLQSILDKVNALPEAGSSGVSLPELSDPATAAEIFSGKEAIDANGEAITGTFTIDNELTEMEAKISELSTILDSKAAGSGGTAGSGTAGEWIDVFSLPTALVASPISTTYYLEVPDNVTVVVVGYFVDGYIQSLSYARKNTSTSASSFSLTSTTTITLSDANGDGTILGIAVEGPTSDVYALPIYTKEV